jgi:uncharacterized protein (TIGR00255 family)
MNSMTGYGYQETQDQERSLSLEIKGYNSRYLEILISLPPFLSALEPRIRSYMVSRFQRGKIDLNLRIKEDEPALTVSVNRSALMAYGEAIAILSETLHLDEKPSLSLLLGLEGVLKTGVKSGDSEQYWTRIEPLLYAAADKFEAERIREGRHTEADIRSHLEVIDTSLKKVSALAPELEASIRSSLRARFMEFLQDADLDKSGHTIDEGRILAEVAVLMVKYTISEEISRLGSHLGEFRAELGRNPSPGKKLEFLCQELHREINTIGSKTPILDVSRAVVDMKDALEKIREQLRNVE